MKRNSERRTSQIRIGLGLARYALKATFRNKAGYFFSLVFPLVFVAAFGLLGNPKSSLRLGVDPQTNRSHTVYQELARQSALADAPIELVEAPRAELDDKLRRNQIAALLVPGSADPTEVELLGSSGNTAGLNAAQAMVGGVLVEKQRMQSGEAAYPVETRIVPGRPFRHIDFGLPGQIGFSMLSLATFGIGFTLNTLRKTLVIKRMLATAVHPLTFVVALCLARSVQAVFQTVVLLAVGILCFHFTLLHGWATAVQLLLLSFVGVLSFLGFGILISNLWRDDQTLPVMLNLFNLPQLLLAGVFFPTDGMPLWLQYFGNNLPLAYLNQALRKVSMEGAGLLQVWPFVFGMVAWGAVTYVLAARTFSAAD